MEIQLTEDPRAIDENVREVCAAFRDDYWTECEENSRFPSGYYQAIAVGGWLGITMPEEVGGAGLGATDAAIMICTPQHRAVVDIRQPPRSTSICSARL